MTYNNKPPVNPIAAALVANARAAELRRQQSKAKMQTQAVAPKSTFVKPQGVAPQPDRGWGIDSRTAFGTVAGAGAGAGAALLLGSNPVGWAIAAGAAGMAAPQIYDWFNRPDTEPRASVIPKPSGYTSAFSGEGLNRPPPFSGVGSFGPPRKILGWTKEPSAISKMFGGAIEPILKDEYTGPNPFTNLAEYGQRDAWREQYETELSARNNPGYEATSPGRILNRFSKNYGGDFVRALATVPENIGGVWSRTAAMPTKNPLSKAYRFILGDRNNPDPVLGNGLLMEILRPFEAEQQQVQQIYASTRGLLGITKQPPMSEKALDYQLAGKVSDAVRTKLVVEYIKNGTWPESVPKPNWYESLGAHLAYNINNAQDSFKNLPLGEQIFAAIATPKLVSGGIQKLRGGAQLIPPINSIAGLSEGFTPTMSLMEDLGQINAGRTLAREGERAGRMLLEQVDHTPTNILEALHTELYLKQTPIRKVLNYAIEKGFSIFDLQRDSKARQMVKVVLPTINEMINRFDGNNIGELLDNVRKLGDATPLTLAENLSNVQKDAIAFFQDAGMWSRKAGTLERSMYGMADGSNISAMNSIGGLTTRKLLSDIAEGDNEKFMKLLSDSRILPGATKETIDIAKQSQSELLNELMKRGLSSLGDTTPDPYRARAWHKWQQWYASRFTLGPSFGFGLRNLQSEFAKMFILDSRAMSMDLKYMERFGGSTPEFIARNIGFKGGVRTVETRDYQGPINKSKWKIVDAIQNSGFIMANKGEEAAGLRYYWATIERFMNKWSGRGLLTEGGEHIARLTNASGVRVINQETVDAIDSFARTVHNPKDLDNFIDAIKKGLPRVEYNKELRAVLEKASQDTSVDQELIRQFRDVINRYLESPNASKSGVQSIVYKWRVTTESNQKAMLAAINNSKPAVFSPPVLTPEVIDTLSSKALILPPPAAVAPPPSAVTPPVVKPAVAVVSKIDSMTLEQVSGRIGKLLNEMGATKSPQKINIMQTELDALLVRKGVLDEEGRLAREAFQPAPRPAPAVATTPAATSKLPTLSLTKKSTIDKNAVSFFGENADKIKPGTGWKIHLSVEPSIDDPLTKEISNWLTENKILHKVGKQGDQVGKGMTIYIGKRIDLESVAKKINAQFGSRIPAPIQDVLIHDEQILGNIWGRFEITHFDRDFHQYGKGGVPYYNRDMAEIVFRASHPDEIPKMQWNVTNGDEAKAIADTELRRRYGTSYRLDATSSAPAPAAAEPVVAAKPVPPAAAAAPQAAIEISRHDAALLNIYYYPDSEISRIDRDIFIKNANLTDAQVRKLAEETAHKVQQMYSERAVPYLGPIYQKFKESLPGVTNEQAEALYDAFKSYSDRRQELLRHFLQTASFNSDNIVPGTATIDITKMPFGNYPLKDADGNWGASSPITLDQFLNSYVTDMVGPRPIAALGTDMTKVPLSFFVGQDSKWSVVGHGTMDDFYKNVTAEQRKNKAIFNDNFSVDESNQQDFYLHGDFLVNKIYEDMIGVNGLINNMSPSDLYPIKPPPNDTLINAVEVAQANEQIMVDLFENSSKMVVKSGNEWYVVDKEFPDILGFPHANKIDAEKEIIKDAQKTQQYVSDYGGGTPEDIADLIANPEKISAESLAKAFNVKPEVGEASLVLAQKMNLPLENILVARGGEAAQDALTQGAKGSMEIVEGGKALIRGFKNSDASTAVHEIAHVARRFLFDINIPEANRLGITNADINIAEAWSGVTNGVWEAKHDEKFARGFERYMRDGNAPTDGLKRIFAKFEQWLGDIYKVLTGSEIDIEVSPEMREVFDRLVTRSEFKATPASDAVSDFMVGQRVPMPNVGAATTSTEPSYWDLFGEELTDDLVAFAPARSTGKLDYDMQDVAARFVEYAKTNKSGKAIDNMVADFAKIDQATPSQIRKLRESVKSVLANEVSPATVEPWMMTREEYGKQEWDIYNRQLIDERSALRKGEIEVGPFSIHKYKSKAAGLREVEKELTKITRERNENGYKNFGDHYGFVSRAIQEGKPVPASVLADYPDIVANVSPATVEPWMMTREEWAVSRKKAGDIEISLLKPVDKGGYLPGSSSHKALMPQGTPERIRLEYGVDPAPIRKNGVPVVTHERVIAKALAEGKPVPAEVLADYPDLVPNVSPATVSPERVGNQSAIPTPEESARWDALTAHQKPIIEAMSGDALDAFGEKVNVKRRGQSDAQMRERIVNSTHPDDIQTALVPSVSPAAASVGAVEVKLTLEEAAALAITQLKGAENRGNGIFFIPEKLMTPQRRKFLMNFKRGGVNVEVKDWADVTGNPYDKGYAILDRRVRNAGRAPAAASVGAPAVTPSLSGIEAKIEKEIKEEFDKVKKALSEGKPAPSSKYSFTKTQREYINELVQPKIDNWIGPITFKVPGDGTITLDNPVQATNFLVGVNGKITLPFPKGKKFEAAVAQWEAERLLGSSDGVLYQSDNTSMVSLTPAEQQALKYSSNNAYMKRISDIISGSEIESLRNPGGAVGGQTAMQLDKYRGHIQQRLSELRQVAMRVGTEQRDLMLFDYGQKFNFDRVIESVYGYPFWYLRHYGDYARQMMTDPAYLAKMFQLGLLIEKSNAHKDIPVWMRQHLGMEVPDIYGIKDIFGDKTIYMPILSQIAPLQELLNGNFVNAEREKNVFGQAFNRIYGWGLGPHSLIPLIMGTINMAQGYLKNDDEAMNQGAQYFDYLGSQTRLVPAITGYMENKGYGVPGLPSGGLSVDGLAMLAGAAGFLGAPSEKSGFNFILKGLMTVGAAAQFYVTHTRTKDGPKFVGTVYDQKRVANVLVEWGQTEGKIVNGIMLTPELLQDAAIVSKNPNTLGLRPEYSNAYQVWSAAVTESRARKLGPALLSYFGGPGMASRGNAEIKSEQMYRRINEIYDMADDPAVTKEMYSEAWTNLALEFPEMPIYGIFKRFGDDAFDVYAKIALGRVGLGSDRRAVFNSVGLPYDLVSRFYEAKGIKNAFASTTEQSQFKEGIIRMNLLLKAPDMPTKLEWSAASRMYGRLMDELETQYPGTTELQDAFFSLEGESRDQFLLDHLDLKARREMEVALMLNEPEYKKVLAPYYVSLDETQNLIKLMYGQKDPQREAAYKVLLENRKEWSADKEKRFMADFDLFAYDRGYNAMTKSMPDLVAALLEGVEIPLPPTMRADGMGGDYEVRMANNLAGVAAKNVERASLNNRVMSGGLGSGSGIAGGGVAGMPGGNTPRDKGSQAAMLADWEENYSKTNVKASGYISEYRDQLSYQLLQPLLEQLGGNTQALVDAFDAPLLQGKWNYLSDSVPLDKSLVDFVRLQGAENLRGALMLNASGGWALENQTWTKVMGTVRSMSDAEVGRLMSQYPELRDLAQVRETLKGYGAPTLNALFDTIGAYVTVGEDGSISIGVENVKKAKPAKGAGKGTKTDRYTADDVGDYVSKWAKTYFGADIEKLYDQYTMIAVVQGDRAARQFWIDHPQLAQYQEFSDQIYKRYRDAKKGQPDNKMNFMDAVAMLKMVKGATRGNSSKSNRHFGVIQAMTKLISLQSQIGGGRGGGGGYSQKPKQDAGLYANTVAVIRATNPNLANAFEELMQAAPQRRLVILQANPDLARYITKFTNQQLMDIENSFQSSFQMVTNDSRGMGTGIRVYKQRSGKTGL